MVQLKCIKFDANSWYMPRHYIPADLGLQLCLGYSNETNADYQCASGIKCRCWWMHLLDRPGDQSRNRWNVCVCYTNSTDTADYCKLSPSLGTTVLVKSVGGWMNQAYSRLSTTHGHITDCKLACMYWTRLVLVRLASPLKHHPTGKQWCPNPDHYSDSEPARRALTLLCWALSKAEPQILTSFAWRGRGSNHQPPTCQANAQPIQYPAAVGPITKTYKCIKWPQKGFERYKVKGIPYMYY